ncbi:hypothetical protein [Stratiformator vulcanicus]|uniref:Thioredoxin domain-containing protein n=1 Tax=Stratiformator vulcanicus TaxID=2527980 RepID=A0A517R425_9PLAN|nr:hypothetical protein [Stratiformator vulcanicus]QDT38645.1 hypothetical protein Pan189_30400 [Stratiformator vulcanicus]
MLDFGFSRIQRTYFQECLRARSLFSLLALAAVLVFASSGCNEPTSVGEEDSTVENGSSALRPGASLVPASEQQGSRRETVAGTWQFLFYNSGSGEQRVGRDISGGFITFEKTDDGYRAKDFKSNSIFSDAELVDSEVTAETVKLTFKNNNTFEFDGSLWEDGVIRGGMQFNFPMHFLLRLVPHSGEITEADLKPMSVGMTDGFGPAKIAYRSGDPVDAFTSVLEEYPGSPAGFEAVDDFLSDISEVKAVDSNGVREIGDALVEFGKRWSPATANYARVTIATSLMSQGYQLDIADEFLATAKEESSPEFWSYWEEVIDSYRDFAIILSARREIKQAARAIESADDSEDLEVVRSIYGKHPYDPIVMYRAADAETKAENLEQAAEILGQMVALPGLESSILQSSVSDELSFIAPKGRLGGIWSRLDREDDALDDFLDELREKHLFYFLDSVEVPSLNSDGRTVLTEMFTGQGCPPCVAADLALDGAQQAVQGDKLISLRYHLHVPYPDPLTNLDSQQRSEYYGVRGTPTVFVNGVQPTEPLAGGFTNAPDSYERLLDAISAENQQTASGIQLQANSSVGGQTLHVSARATAEKSIPSSVRLRCVIAEPEVVYAGQNGIVEHRMVARLMPGGPDGVGGQDNAINFETSIPLSDIPKNTNEALDQYEQAVTARSEFQFKFLVRPLELDELRLIAFVQDDETKEVLAAIEVPITGEYDFAAVSEEHAKASDAEENANAGTEESGPALRPANQSDSTEDGDEASTSDSPQEAGSAEEATPTESDQTDNSEETGEPSESGSDED